MPQHKVHATTSKTIQMMIDEALLEAVDAAVEELSTTRSAFILDALAEALRRLRIARLEAQHEAAYTRLPPQPGEFDIFIDEQDREAREAV